MSRFFFALWPDITVRNTVIHRCEQISFSGKETEPSKLHITLLFLGKLNVNQQQKIIKKAEAINWQKFEINLTKTGCFKKNKIAWLGLNSIPDALLELNKTLISIAEKSQIKINQQSFIPHMTLARKSDFIEIQSILAIPWIIDQFVLVESIDTNSGVKYQIIKKFTCS